LPPVVILVANSVKSLTPRLEHSSLRESHYNESDTKTM
jgi:hypothetical protein